MMHPLIASLALFGPVSVLGRTGRPNIPARCPPEVENCVICRAKAFSTATSFSQDDFVEVGVSVGHSLCDGDETVNIDETVSGLALAVAEAIAVTSVECTGNGQGEGAGEAIARAVASAEATATAIASGWLSVDNCNGCQIATDLFASATKTVLVEAVANSESKITEFVPLRLRESRELIQDFVHDVQDALIPAFASVIAEVKASLDSCEIDMEVCASVGDDGRPNCCEVNASNVAETVEEDAFTSIVEIGELLNASCDPTTDDVSVFIPAAAHATGRAVARAVASIGSWCYSSGNGNACAMASGSIEVAAEAQASAFAKAIGDLHSCGCDLDVSATASSFQSVIVEAAAVASVEQYCTNEGLADDVDFQEDVVSATVDALSELYISLSIDAQREECKSMVCAGAATAINGADLFDNSAQCCIEPAVVVREYANDALTVAVADASATTCAGDPAAATASAADTAEAIANVSAYALAGIDIACESHGDHSWACAAGDAVARAHAEATAEAIAVAWSEAVSCGQCEVVSESTAEVLKTVIADAVASAWAGLCADGDVGALSVEDWRSAFDADSIAAFASAVATAEVNSDEGLCNVSTEACAAVGSEEGCCKAALTAGPEELAQEDGYATAIAESGVNFLRGVSECADVSGDQTVEASVVAESVATAWAKAVTDVNIECSATDDVSVCTWAQSSITTTAQAIGYAFAEAWAGELVQCGCDFEVDEWAEVMATVAVDATLEVLRDVCLSGDTHVEDAVFEEIESKSQPIFAMAISQMQQTRDEGGQLVCTGSVDTSVGLGAAPAAAEDP